MRGFLNLFVILGLIFQGPLAMAAGRLQNEDFKSLAELKSLYTATGSFANGSTCLTNLSTFTGLQTGLYVYDTTNALAITDGTKIVAIPGTCSSGQIQISLPAPLTGTNHALTFGASKAQLLNDTKMYISANGVNDTLYNAILNGQIGGGGGGASGIELLPNPAFESGGVANGWTATGLTAVTITADSLGGDSAKLIQGKRSAKLTATAANQTFKSAAIPVLGLGGGNCSAKISYLSTGTVFDWTLSVTNGTTTIASAPLPVSSSASTPFVLMFPCGTGTLQYVITANLSTANPLYLDNAHLGSNDFIGQVQSYEIGSVFYTAAANCPIGAVYADGSNIASSYPDLAKAISSPTVPDLRGLFVRGTGANATPLNGKTVAGGVSPGTLQGDATAKNGLADTGHSHTAAMGAFNNNGYPLSARQDLVLNATGFKAIENTSSGNAAPVYGPGIQNGSANLVGDAETRPANMSLTPCVQATSSKVSMNQTKVLDTLGAVIWTGAPSCPGGSIPANGASYSTTDEAFLFARIGYTFGGSGANFNVPNLQGIFIRGAGSQTINGKGYGATLGAVQNDRIENHYHTGTTGGNINGGVNIDFGGGHSGNVTGSGHQHNFQSNNWSSYGDGSETIPANIGMTACISNSVQAAPLLVNGVVAPYSGTTRINAVKTVTANYTLTEQDETVFVDSTSGPITITLPSATTFKGKRFFVTKTNLAGNHVTINTLSGDGVGPSIGLTTALHRQDETAGFTSDGNHLWRFNSETMRTEVAYVNNGNPNEVTQQVGSWLTAAGAIQSGLSKFAFSADLFPGGAYCVCSAAGSNATSCLINSTGSPFVVGTANAGNYVDEPLTKVTCSGKRY